MSDLRLAAEGGQLDGPLGWVADVIDALGPAGVAVLVAIENIFPPIPSEVVLPFAGFVVGRDGGSPVVMIAAATAGSVVGAVVLYALGRRVGLPRVRRWLVRLPLVDADDVDASVAWFERHGRASVLFGRCVPLVRSLISLPAGAEEMPRLQFLLYTTIGSAVFNTVLILAGLLLGQRWRQVAEYVDLATYALLGLVLVAVLRFVWRRRDRLPGR